MAAKKHPMAVLVGKRLRAVRTRGGLETIKVAQLLGYDRQTIIGWENGFAFLPIPKVVELCRQYQCSTDEIIVGAEPDSWEGVVAHMPVDLREKTLIMNARPAVGNLVTALNNMTDEQLTPLEDLLPKLALVGEAGMDAVEKVINGLTALISSTARHSGVHSTECRPKVM